MEKYNEIMSEYNKNMASDVHVSFKKTIATDTLKQLQELMDELVDE